MQTDDTDKSTTPLGTVLVTGGAGYIGSHVVVELLDAGWQVVVIDDLSTGRADLVDARARLVVGDVGDRNLLENLLEDETIDAVIHLAARTELNESLQQPLNYYLTNAAASRELIAACRDAGIGRFVYSSTAAVYGPPRANPVAEDHPRRPTTPYGRSKLVTEWMLQDTDRAHDIRHVTLRYFNVAGADPELRTGQPRPDATDLISVAVQAAVGDRDQLQIFGTDYPTEDGSCIRDYIHVTDLARAHLQALDHLVGGGESLTVNCGYGRGVSVRQVVEAVRRVSGRDFPVRDAPRRPGDLPEVVADVTKLKRDFHWSPRYNDLDTIVSTALKWHRTYHDPPFEP